MSFFKLLNGKIPYNDEHIPPRGQDAKRSSDEKHSYQQLKKSHEPQYQFSDFDSASPSRSSSYPTSEVNPPPYKSWLEVPDSSQLPPPPTLGNDYSSTNNASFDSAAMGHKWCTRNAIHIPSVPRKAAIIEISQAGELGFDPAPAGFKGSIRQLDKRIWEIKTEKTQGDTTLISTLPAYFAAMSNPLLSTTDSYISRNSISFSFSVTINTIAAESTVAIGVMNKPYPPFRLPGWHRGSLAIHSDDGNRYINDPYGGIDFTRPLQQNDSVRVSVTVLPQTSPVQEYHGKFAEVKRVGSLPKCVTQVRVERNGMDEGHWEIHEERDGEKDEGIEGLQGEADLYCAVGVCGMSRLVVRFERSSC